MPTPTYALRLAKKTQDDIAELAKIYGSPNGRAFAREILEVTCSGDVARIQAFNRRLMMGMGEQMALKLNATLDEVAAPEPKERKPRKKRRARAKRT
jgi:hypothetical protein